MTQARASGARQSIPPPQPLLADPEATSSGVALNGMPCVSSESQNFHKPVNTMAGARREENWKRFWGVADLAGL